MGYPDAPFWGVYIYIYITEVLVAGHSCPSNPPMVYLPLWSVPRPLGASLVCRFVAFLTPKLIPALGSSSWRAFVVTFGRQNVVKVCNCHQNYTVSLFFKSYGFW